MTILPLLPLDLLIGTILAESTQSTWDHSSDKMDTMLQKWNWLPLSEESMLMEMLTSLIMNLLNS